MAGFTPVITDVPFDPEVVAPLIQYLPTDKNSLSTSGVLVRDNRFVNVAGRNTGKITLPAISYKFDKPMDYTGDQDAVFNKLPNVEQTSVVVGKYMAWKVNELANYIANGMTPEQAVLNYIQSHKDRVMFEIVKSMLKGMFAASDIQGALIYDKSTKPLTTADFFKARYAFWGDEGDEAPVFYIMHSVVYASLMSKMTETTMVNFLQGAQIILDDNITTESAGVYETYMFKRGAIAYSGELAGSRGFTEKSETKQQGEIVIGYKNRQIFSPVGVSFEGALAKVVTASDTELETGTNWKMVLDKKRVGFGMIKSLESIDPETVELSVKASTSKKSE